MANINDYIIWRGDLPLSPEHPFNEVDSMVLARFSYLVMQKIDMAAVETVADISRKMKDFTDEDFRYQGDRQLIRLMGKSERFGGMKVTDFVLHNNEEFEKQFGAVTIHYLDNQMYVSFMGTDSSLVGWKEDFNMSFMDQVPAQVEGLSYLTKVCVKYPDRRLRLGGHSKGGNVAIYAGMNAPSWIKRAIISVDSFDGPGFSHRQVKEHEGDPILGRICNYIPQDSVFGRILEHGEKSQIVESDQKKLMQHDIYSWQVVRDHMVHLEEMGEEGDKLYQIFADWLKESTPKQREVFVDGMFKLFASANAETFTGARKAMMHNIPQVWKTYRDFPEEDRKTLIKMWMIFAKNYTSSLIGHKVYSYDEEEQGGTPDDKSSGTPDDKSSGEEDNKDKSQERTQEKDQEPEGRASGSKEDNNGCLETQTD